METPPHLFEIILRYLYNQDQSVSGVSSCITDLILEVSYFELTDFEKELWELFEKEADATNCVKALILMESNALFEMNKDRIFKYVFNCKTANTYNLHRAAANRIKGVMENVASISQWAIVQELLNPSNVQMQNPVRILEGVKAWCEEYEPDVRILF